MTFYITKVFSEVDPINDKEKHDEIAKAEERSLWIACLYLAHTKLESLSDSLQTISISSNHPLKTITKKLAADILDQSVIKITAKEAENILSNEFDLEENRIKELVLIDLKQFKKEEIKMSQRQALLIEKIEKEINSNENNFKDPPESLFSEVFENKLDWVYFVIIGILLIGCVGGVYLFKKKSEPVIKNIKKTKKKA